MAQFLFSLILTLLLAFSSQQQQQPFLQEQQSEQNAFEFKEFTTKKDITQFINSQFANPPNFNIEYFTGEVQIGPVQIYPGDDSSWMFTTEETGKLQRLFYQFMSANGTKISVDQVQDHSYPIILWMQGGPGCSDWFGANTEFGPYRLFQNSSGIWMNENPNSWAKYAYLLFVDNPFGDGLSPVIGNSTGQVPMVGSAMESAAIVQKFLEIFCMELYPMFLKHPFYIFGESFGGHYVPALSSRLVSTKSIAAGNFKGIGFGDGWTSPLDQAGCYGPYLYSAGIVSTKRKEKYKLLSGTIQEAIMVHDYPTATSLFFNYDGGMGPDSKIRVTQTNLLNYRQYFQDYPSSDALANWIGLDNVREAFNLPKNLTDPFTDCSNALYMNFNYDTPVDYSGNVTYLLQQGYKVMLYEGQVDPDVSENGVLYYLNTLKWSQLKYWNRSAKKIWYNPNPPYENWGWYKVYGRFHYVLTNNAGHLVPHDQGAASQHTVYRFINDLW